MASTNMWLLQQGSVYGDAEQLGDLAHLESVGKG